MRSQETKRGCTILLVGLPICGFLATGIAGLALTMLFLFLMMVGCAAPPATVGVITYPPNEARLPTGEVFVQVRAYRRGWATLQFDSGWQASYTPPDAIEVHLDGVPVFTWRKGDPTEWRETLSLPVRLSEGEHRLTLMVEADGRTARDEVRVQAIASDTWQVARLSETERQEVSQYLFIADSAGTLWRTREAPANRVEIARIERVEGETPSSFAEAVGVITAVRGTTAHMFLIHSATLVQLDLQAPISPSATLGRIVARPDGTFELLWYEYLTPERWDGQRWQASTMQIPARNALYETPWEAERPDDVWIWSRRSQYAAHWDGRGWFIVAPPSRRARLIRARVALEGRRFWLWNGTEWQRTAPLPEPPSPFALEFDVAERVVLCGERFFFVSPAYEWEEDVKAYRHQLRLFRWDGHTWTWEDVSVAPFPYGRLACVGTTPWLMSSAVAPRHAMQRSSPQVAARWGNRWLGPEATLTGEQGRFWSWDGHTWREAVQAPLWGDSVAGNGIGLLDRTHGVLTIATP
nr:hypothetical protein [Ardenticatena sp.]